MPTSAPVFNGKGGATLGLPRPAVSVAKGAGAAKGAGQVTPRTPGWQNPFSSREAQEAQAGSRLKRI